MQIIKLLAKKPNICDIELLKASYWLRNHLLFLNIWNELLSLINPLTSHCWARVFSKGMMQGRPISLLTLFLYKSLLNVHNQNLIVSQTQKVLFENQGDLTFRGAIFFIYFITYVRMYFAQLLLKFTVVRLQRYHMNFKSLYSSI